MSDLDVGVGPSIGGAPAARPVDQGFLRTLKIVGAVVVVAVALVIYLLVKYASGGSSSGDSGAAAVINAGANSVQEKQDAQQSDAMQQMLRQRQAMEAEQARREGRTHIPSEVVGSVEPVKQAPAPELPPSTMQNAYANVNYGGGPNSDQIQTLRAGLRNQLLAIVPQPSDSGDGVRQSISVDRRQQSSAGQSGSDQPVAQQRVSAQASSQSASSQAGGSGQVLIQALEIVTGKLANPITAIMGKPSYASALITSGPFAGAFLTGTSTMNENETIEVTFNMMRFGNKAYKIDAIVLDEQTANAGVQGDIDRRLLQRYLLPITVAMAQGYFAASAQTGSTLITGTGTIGTATPPPTYEQARNAGIAAGLGTLNKDVQKAAQEPIRSSVQRDMPIGILFRAPVLQ